jgi:hypothetical protein
LMTGGHEGIQQRSGQAPDREIENWDAGEQDDQFAVGVGNKLEREGLDGTAELIREIVLSVYPCQTHRQCQPDEADTNDEKGDPALNQHARPKPNSPAVQRSIPLRGSDLAVTFRRDQL